MSTTDKITYTQLKARQQAEVNAFPMVFAFSTEQFVEAMAKLGLMPEDTDKICTIGHIGGFCLRTDADALIGMLDRHSKELAIAMHDYDFAVSAFNNELADHEYCITYDTNDALGALGLDDNDIEANKVLAKALRTAIKKQRHWGA